MGGISILIPSRGRPGQARRMYESMLDTSDAECLFYLNSNDPLLGDYDVPHIVGPDQPTCASWNYLASLSDADFMMEGSDDSVWRTKDWDKRVYEVATDICLISFADGRTEDGRPNWVVSREWYERLGYFMWPELLHWYVDTWNTDVSDRAECAIHLPDVLYEHMTWKAGKAEWDGTYQRMRDHGHIHPHDTAVFNGGEEIRKRHAEKLR